MAPIKPKTTPGYVTVPRVKSAQVEFSEAADPRIFTRGFDPRGEPDQRIIQQHRARSASVVPINEVFERLYAKNLPPQLVQAQYFILLQATQTPMQLLFKNPRRQSFIIGNFGDTVINFAYDFPVQIAAATYGGIPIASGAYYTESNGSISINDIWVWATGAPVFPYPIIAYEGTLSMSGNRR